MNISRIVAVLAFFVLPALCGAAPAGAQAKSAGASSAAKPAATEQMVIPSQGENLLGIFYLAAGAGPHPTAIIFHGFPGYEQNLDIAQFLRARGWNVLAMHYRGSWGVKGDFSFEHSAEDADTQVHFVLDEANAKKYGIDTRRVMVIGHSMGGFMAASAIAHNKRVAGAVLISAWNIGTVHEIRSRDGAASTVEKLAEELSRDNNLLPLSGTSAEKLAHEIYEHQSALNMNNLGQAIARRPVFVITANEGLAPSDHAFAEALRKAGDTHVAERHWNTDHSYSGERAGLASAILEWAQANLPH
ncbi:MAG TPA: alpha/beta fold hydrolase [Verrucomicrobiae bacterium]|nr:alpha/beta fold hydrolase [Verrucomicrobiae bacterium]